MQQNIQNIFQFSTTAGDVLTSIFIAFICGSLVALFYQITYRGAGYPVTFIFSLITLSMITTIVIMVIGNNLARAFGLVGAMSIIRFRTAVKETQDIMFIFFSLAMGMAAGVGLYTIAIASTIFIGIILVILTKILTGVSKMRKYLLQFTYSFNGDDTKEPPYLPILKKYCKTNKLVNTKSHSETDMLELSYYVDLKDINKNTEFINKLKNLEGLKHVNLFFDDEDI
ncbi:MAG: DUF4956 domain-containing protein [Bacteroidales bacterium]|nr:DUF4956 domain-containing protein [Bacteroidales bacterium]